MRPGSEPLREALKLPFRLDEPLVRPRLRAVALTAVGGSVAVHGIALAWALAQAPASRDQAPAPIPLSIVAVREEGPSVLASGSASAPAPARATPPAPRPAPRTVPRPRTAAPSERPAASPLATALLSPEPSEPADPGADPAEVAALAPTPPGDGSGAGPTGTRHVFGEGEVDRAARPALRIRPRYPERARRMGRESDVRMVVTVEADGVVSAVELAQSGGDEFDREARLALERSRFEPALEAGTPVAALVTFTVRFRLDDE